MITLLQAPTTGGRITGGYRYNAEMVDRLEQAALGRLVEVESHELGGFIASDAETIVFDSLYITQAEPPRWIGDASRSLLLLHFVPSADPTLDKHAVERALERERAWIAAVDGVVTTSSHVAALVAERHGRDAVVATPGISAHFRPNDDEARTARSPVTVVSVGPVTRAKGQLETVRALAAAATTDSRALRLVLIGDADTDAEYVRDVQGAAGSVQIEFAGTLAPEDVATRLRTADAFVSASTFESFGMAVVEAVASGIPVVALDVGEAARWVRDGENGYLVDVADPERFARAVADVTTGRSPFGRALGSPRGGALFFPSWEHTFECFARAATGHVAFEASDDGVELYSRCMLPTELGDFEVHVYRFPDGEEALLVFMGDLSDAGGEAPFVRVHSECFTGEVLGSLKCDCRSQLDLALREIADVGRGAVVYLRQEGRGIGLANKIRAYAEQERGADTIEANEVLGFPADLRDFRAAALILRLAGARRVTLNTNNPEKVESLERNGVAVAVVVPSSTKPNPHNLDYLETKYRSMGHAGLIHALRRVDGGEHPLHETRGGVVARARAANGERRKPLVILDLDGVIQLGDRVPDQARELVATLRSDGYALRYLTNDGINSRASRCSELASLGLDVAPGELYTASYLTARFVAESGGGRVLALCGRPALDEFEAVEGAERIQFVSSDADIVLVGDYFSHYDFDVLRSAYDALANGARLVAMHTKPSWPIGGKRVIDIGFWVAGLEYCAGCSANVVGKPSAYSYQTVLKDAGYEACDAIMISDETAPDLVGARKLGIETVLFENGLESADRDASHRVAASYTAVGAAVREGA